MIYRGRWRYIRIYHPIVYGVTLTTIALTCLTLWLAFYIAMIVTLSELF